MLIAAHLGRIHIPHLQAVMTMWIDRLDAGFSFVSFQIKGVEYQSRKSFIYQTTAVIMQSQLRI